MSSTDETTITVRGVDLNTWKEFQKAIIDLYGNLYGYLGTEVSKALGLWLTNRAGGTSPAPVAEASTTSEKHTVVRPGTLAYRIHEAMEALGGEASIQDVVSHINEKHGHHNAGSISTSMSDLAVNGPPSSHYSENEKFLERVGRARYRLVSNGEA